MASHHKQQGVAKGGIWSTARPEVSRETQDLLKVMMQESKLNNFQQRQLKERLKGGEAFPTDVPPSTSAKGELQLTAKATKTTTKRQSSGSGKRTQEDIQRRLDNDTEEPYKPKPGKCITEKDKRRLQNTMAYGEDGANIDDTPRLPKPQPRQAAKDPEIDRFEEVMQLIEERKKFLDHMEKIGEGKKYRTIIETEISQSIRELEVIDQKRTNKLKSALALEKNIDNET